MTLDTPKQLRTEAKESIQGLDWNGPCFSLFWKMDDTKVPESVKLEGDLRREAKLLGKVGLVPIDYSFGIVTARETSAVPLKEVVTKQARKEKANVVVVYAVRRPGWHGCRQQGKQLSQLAAELRKTAFVGIVKEKEDNGILDFYNKYFKFPLYQDPKWKTYKALGSRKITTGQIIVRVLKWPMVAAKRLIKSERGGSDMKTQGGILIYDRTGNLRYAYQEQYGEPLDMESIQAAIDAARIDDESTIHSLNSI